MPKSGEVSFEVFIADRCPAGYGWDTSGARPLTLVALSDERTPYAPPPDLFLTLADNPPSPETVLKLANQFGYLTVGIDNRRPPVVRLSDNRPCEYFESWQSTIFDIRAATLLYSALIEHGSGNAEPLEKLIGRTKDGRVVVVRSPDLLDPEEAIELGKGFGRGDLAGPAQGLLQQLVNDGLRGEGSQISPLLVRGTSAGLTLRIVPMTLQGCAWLQLAKVISGGESYRQCRNCGKWMLIAREQAGYRPNRNTCSNACRMQIYLKRQAEAVELSRQGSSTAEIAKRLDTEVETVKGWLNAKGVSVRPKSKTTMQRARGAK